MIKRYQRTAISQYILVGLILVTLVLLGYLSTLAMKNIPFEDHFALPWAAGRAWLLEGKNPYGSSLVPDAENAVEAAGYQGRLPAQVLLVPALPNLFFFLPFSLVPYEFSRALWVVLLIVLVGFIIHYSLKLSEWNVSRVEKIAVFILLMLWFPGIYSIFTGQLTLVIVFIALLALTLIKSGRFQAGGFVLALTAGSLPLVLLIIVFAILWSISKKQWTFLIALISGIAFLLVVSLLMLPSWPVDWLRNILDIYQDFSWVATPLMTLATILPGISQFLSIALHAVLGIFLLAIYVDLFRKSDRVFMWSSLAVFALAFTFHVQYALPGLYLVVPALCLVFRFSFDRWGSVGKIITWLLLLAVTVGSWMLMLPEISFYATSSSQMLMVALPMFTLLGLVWIRWWAVKLTRLPQI